MRDLAVNQNGDIMVDPLTHDLMLVDGIDEIAQRIRATLSIRLGEMKNLAPEQGTNYTNFFLKNFQKNVAQTDMVDAIERNVPEVQQVTDLNFKQQPNRVLEITFKVNIVLADGTTGIAKGGLEIGN